MCLRSLLNNKVNAIHLRNLLNHKSLNKPTQKIAIVLNHRLLDLNNNNNINKLSSNKMTVNNKIKNINQNHSPNLVISK